jgi:hypothetical protein
VLLDGQRIFEQRDSQVTSGYPAVAAGVGAVIERFEQSDLGGAPRSPAPNPSTVADSSSFSFGGHRYQWVPGMIKWGDAKAKAASMGGHLATITSREEHDFVIEKVRQLVSQRNHAWIGASRARGSVDWKWVTGEPFDFTGWQTGQPDASLNFDCYADYWHADSGKIGWDDTPGENNPRQGFIVEWDDAGSAPAIAATPSPASTAPATGAMNPGSTTKAVLPPAPATPTQTIDLLSLTDPVKDRGSLGSEGKANYWEKAGSVLTYKSDGFAGKLTAPVSLKNLRDYEVGIFVRRLNGSDRLNLNLPISDSQIATLGLFRSDVTLNFDKRLSPWPADATNDVRAVARVRRSADGTRTAINVTINGQPAGQWEGDTVEISKPASPHPDFRNEATTDIACYRDSFAFAAWQLRVYDGEATMLRGASAAAPADAVANAKASAKLFDGKSLHGWRLQGSPDSFVVDDGCIKANGPRATLMFSGLPDVPPIMKDFVLTLKVKTEDKANSGIFVHCPLNKDNVSFSNALEIQIANENSDPQKTGSVWSVQRTNKLIVHDGEWFDLRIEVRGMTVTSYINDGKVVEWTQPEGWTPPKAGAQLSAGTIGLQSNGGVVWFKDLELRAP